jgi:hypothetical protein
MVHCKAAPRTLRGPTHVLHAESAESRGAALRRSSDSMCSYSMRSYSMRSYSMRSYSMRSYSMRSYSMRSYSMRREASIPRNFSACAATAAWAPISRK